jgi:hypothetical protein
MPRRVVPILVPEFAALAQRVEFAMQRKDQRRVVGDHQIVGIDDALGGRPVDFADQRQGSSTTPLPITASLPGPHDAGRQRDSL